MNVMRLMLVVSVFAFLEPMQSVGADDLYDKYRSRTFRYGIQDGSNDAQLKYVRKDDSGRGIWIDADVDEPDPGYEWKEFSANDRQIEFRSVTDPMLKLRISKVEGSWAYTKAKVAENFGNPRYFGRWLAPSR